MATFVLRSWPHDAGIKRWLPAIALSALLVPAAMLGYRTLPAATVSTGPVHALTLKHQSFGRMDSIQDLELQVKQSKGHSVRLYLDSQFLQAFAIERTLPLAKTVQMSSGAQVLTFDSPADADLAIKLSVRPQSWGQHDVPLRADVPGVLSAESTLSQFVVP